MGCGTERREIADTDIPQFSVFSMVDRILRSLLEGKGFRPCGGTYRMHLLREGVSMASAEATCDALRQQLWTRGSAER